MRPALFALFAALLLSSVAPNLPARAQAPLQGDPNAAEERGLTTPEVKRSQMPEPTEQGTRPPKPTDTPPQMRPDLYEALADVRRAPPGLDGRPIPRPNPLGSEPATEMAPDPAGNPEVLFPDGYVE